MGNTKNLWMIGAGLALLVSGCGPQGMRRFYVSFPSSGPRMVLPGMEIEKPRVPCTVDDADMAVDLWMDPALQSGAVPHSRTPVSGVQIDGSDFSMNISGVLPGWGGNASNGYSGTVQLPDVGIDVPAGQVAYFQLVGTLRSACTIGNEGYPVSGVTKVVLGSSSGSVTVAPYVLEMPLGARHDDGTDSLATLQGPYTSIKMVGPTGANSFTLISSNNCFYMNILDLVDVTIAGQPMVMSGDTGSDLATSGSETWADSLILYGLLPARQYEATIKATGTGSCASGVYYVLKFRTPDPDLMTSMSTMNCTYNSTSAPTHYYDCN